MCIFIADVKWHLTHEVAAGGLFFVCRFLIVIELLIAPKRFGAQHLLIIHRGGNFVYVVCIYCRYKYEFSLSCYYHIYWVPKIEMHATTYGANQSQNPQSEGVLEISWFEIRVTSALTGLTAFVF